MNIAIIVSTENYAGINTKENLIKLFPFKKTSEVFDDYEIYSLNKIKIYTTNNKLIFYESIDKKIHADLFIFATTHKSEKNINSLSLHSIGNFNQAGLGGKSKTLVPLFASFMKLAFIELNNQGKNSSYEITLEATHHGPFLEKPSMFIEIGSSEKQWKDKEAGSIIAKTIINTLTKNIPGYEVALALGGTHYCANFNKIMLNSNIALSFICPKFNLQYLDEDLLKQMIEKTQEKIDFILLDWKGLGQEKQKILNLINKLNLKYKRIDQLN